MKKLLSPLAMLAGLAVSAYAAVEHVISTSCMLFFELLRHGEADQFEAELEQARQSKTADNAIDSVVEPFGTAQAREFVTMLRGIGSGSRERCLA